LLEFQPGDILYNVEVSPELCAQTGKYLAEINTVLESFKHPAYENHSTIWALDSVPKLDEFLFAVKDEHQNQLSSKIVECFKERVVPLIPKLPKGKLIKKISN
jgi:Ser/Thr protein kinase RdoA (MazF antagonist)